MHGYLFRMGVELVICNYVSLLYMIVCGALRVRTADMRVWPGRSASRRVKNERRGGSKRNANRVATNARGAVLVGGA